MKKNDYVFISNERTKGKIGKIIDIIVDLTGVIEHNIYVVDLGEIENEDGSCSREIRNFSDFELMKIENLDLFKIISKTKKDYLIDTCEARQIASRIIEIANPKLKNDKYYKVEDQITNILNN